MRNMVEKILTGYGMELSLEQEGVVASCHGFFQPIYDTSLQNRNLNLEELGRYGGGKYQIMVPPYVKFDVGGRVLAQGQWYVVRAMELVCGGSESVYRWGLLVKEGAGDGDIS
ncbi:MAG: hypothetical protein R3Y62_00945 [Eubacteriales bacterium]